MANEFVSWNETKQLTLEEYFSFDNISFNECIIYILLRLNEGKKNEGKRTKEIKRNIEDENTEQHV